VVSAVSDEFVPEVAKVAVPAILSFELRSHNIILVKQVLTKLLKRLPLEKVK